ncbi:chemotaxis protein CheW [Roseomonas marmotae]|uniref:Chemotaxis protein CheW n=1 Tax=Roseomonas marmotae TaxID=2768161 RepID=A0ABS3K992_9PROT|nr:chemotaxis protein CheW [Roseomonas marmotae]MBO1074034.1 chemotaxis protein CheW [Roseomonas marmotae]QTI78820.1 chemotaxis protein CheW [Roseomonas marmotae]
MQTEARASGGLPNASLPGILPGAPPVVDAAAEMVLTLTVGGQLCGVPVLAVRDILASQAITRVPLAPREVAGSLNLRGRIVTAIDLRRRLCLPDRAAGGPPPMSVVVEQGGELYSLLSDAVGEVVPLPAEGLAGNPPTLDAIWRDVSRGVHRQGDRLLIMLDVDRILAIG